MPYADKDKQREYQRRWMKERRETWLNENGPCVDCGTWLDLEVDHVDPSRKVTHRVWSWSVERREKELAKCVVRCHPCHESKTNTGVGRRAPHGTGSRYDSGCHCNECRKAELARWHQRDKSYRRKSSMGSGRTVKAAGFGPATVGGSNPPSPAAKQGKSVAQEQADV